MRARHASNYVSRRLSRVQCIRHSANDYRSSLIDNYSHTPKAAVVARSLRICFLVAAVLLASGGGVADSSPKTGKWLALAGYLLFAVVLLILIAMALYFWRLRDNFIPSSRKVSETCFDGCVKTANIMVQVLRGALLASPFLIVRCVYGIVEVICGYGSRTWSPLVGSVVLFALMALLMEYIAICIFFYVGYTTPPDRGATHTAQGEERGGK